MKVVILAGGLGTRISEESHLKPKPMITIGEMPILWHIMKIYSSYGFNEFIICCGYKGYIIKEYFANYYMHRSSVTFDFREQSKMLIHTTKTEPWKVTLVDTGLHTMTGGRIKRIKDYVENEPFMLTYGDGVSDINIAGLVQFHKQHGKLATLTAVNPGQRFGILDINENNEVLSFREKNKTDADMINAGFMVLSPKIFNYINGDKTVFEKEPLEKLVQQNELMAYKHHGFWQCMDTQRDRQHLEELWESGKAPWKNW